jgi:hypothetical protein
MKSLGSSEPDSAVESYFLVQLPHKQAFPRFFSLSI